MKERLKTESVDRGVERTIIFLQEWAKDNSTVYNKYFTEYHYKFSSIQYL